jgi:hypothetical protein
LRLLTSLVCFGSGPCASLASLELIVRHVWFRLNPGVDAGRLNPGVDVAPFKLFEEVWTWITPDGPPVFVVFARRTPQGWCMLLAVV